MVAGASFRITVALTLPARVGLSINAPWALAGFPASGSAVGLRRRDEGACHLFM